MRHLRHKCTKNWNTMLNQWNWPRTALRPMLAISLLCTSALALSDGQKDMGNSKPFTNQAYVDSVYEWGLWEMGLTPAAGGAAPSPGRAITYRPSNIAFRPNDNSAFAPVVTPVSVPAPVPTAPVGPRYNAGGSGPVPAGAKPARPNRHNR